MVLYYKGYEHPTFVHKDYWHILYISMGKLHKYELYFRVVVSSLLEASSPPTALSTKQLKILFYYIMQFKILKRVLRVFT